MKQHGPLAIMYGQESAALVGRRHRNKNRDTESD